MALLKAKPSEIPPDAIRLSEDDALEYQAKIIRNWGQLSDVFAVKYGTGILAACASLAGIFLNNHYRTRYGLLNYARLSSYLPTCVIPAAAVIAIHSNFVLRDVMLRKGNCPVCVEMRASALQAGLGCVLPTVLAHLSALSLAHRYHTYDVPYLTREPRKVLELVRMQTRPIANVLFVMFIAQAMIASVVTYFQSENVHKVNLRLLQLETELENS